MRQAVASQLQRVWLHMIEFLVVIGFELDTNTYLVAETLGATIAFCAAK